MRRSAAALLSVLLGLSAAVAVSAPAQAATTDLVINEVESDATDGVDWVELYNPTGADIDASGLRVTDNNPARTYTIASGTIVPAGGFAAIDVSVGTGSFGLGNGDEVHLWDGSVEIDSMSFGAHAIITWGLCPDGDPSGSFVQTASSTKAAANACGVDPADAFVINEIETSGGTPGDWIEIMNTALVAVDAGGLVIRDNDDLSTFVIPTPTLVPAGGFAAFDVEDGDGVNEGFGLNSSDTPRLFEADGTTLIDSYTLPGGAHATTTIGRCPDGSGEFVVTAEPTKAAANECTLPEGAENIRINEIESDLGDPDDWIELHNSGETAYDISGWMIADNGTPEALPASTIVPAGGYLVLERDVHFGFGLGNGDEVHLYLADGVTVVDETSYAEHAEFTWGRCPDVTGEFGETSGATKGAANQCIVDPAEALVINEIESDGGTPGDWVELYNTSALPVDASGLLIKDIGEGNTTAIASGTMIPGNGFLAVDTTGLGSSDTARLTTADGAVIDSYSWGAHADETFGRCPDGIGAFADTDAATKGAANDCPAPVGYEDVVINEVESSGGTPADWVEFYNNGDAAVDMSGWIIHDSDDTHTMVVPAGTSIEPKGFLGVVVDVPGGFGLGNDDRVRLYLPDNATLVDERIWGPDHSPTTFGLCPDGVGDFVQTYGSTFEAPNDCSPVRLNEIESSGGTRVDWVELVNIGTSPVDVSGYVIKDNNDSRTFALPAGTIIQPGAYLAVDVDVTGGFGLGEADSARLYDTTGVLLDSYSWTAHAATTYARCPDGLGGFETSKTPTKGAVNDCSGILPAEVWPGGADVTTVDVANTFGQDMSGLAYETTGTATRGTLWAVNNGSGRLFKLVWNGSAWVPAAGDWASGKALTYTDGTGQPDTEGVGFGGPTPASGVYVATERNGLASGVSRPSVLRYDVAGAGTSITATHEWNLTSVLPITMGNNTGLEGITWVPDSFLISEGFVDTSTGVLYDPTLYPGNNDGLFFIAVEATGDVYAVALQANGTATLVATIETPFTIAAEVTFEPSTGQLWAVCDEACAGRTATYEIAQDGAFDGTFQLTHVYENAAGMDDGIANEGFAIAPQELCIANSKPVFYADDSQRDGHALREGTLACVSTPVEPEPVLPPTEDDLTPGTQNLVSGPAVVTPGQQIEVTVPSSFEGETVGAWIFSEPTTLGQHVVTDAAITVVIPQDIAIGMHRIAVTDAAGAVTGWFGIEVRAAAAPPAPGALASTGLGVAPVIPAAVLFLLAAGTLLLLLRRRTA